METAFWSRGLSLRLNSHSQVPELLEPLTSPGPNMGTRLLCWATFCLLGTGTTDPGVSQSPRHIVTARGQYVAISCDPISGHLSLYWYRQMVGQAPQFLIYFTDNAKSDASGMPQHRFNAMWPKGSPSTLEIEPAEPGDSAVYLCASSKDTALQSHCLPVHKPNPLAQPRSCGNNLCTHSRGLCISL